MHSLLIHRDLAIPQLIPGVDLESQTSFASLAITVSGPAQAPDEETHAAHRLYSSSLQ
jgi:hypothetical protein